MRLVIVSHTAHFRNRDGEIVGWGPTVREIDHLARCFDSTLHVAPLHPEQPPSSALPYRGPVDLRPVRPTGGENLRGKLGVVREAPRYLRVIRQASRSADVMHVRCPANISLFGILLLTLTRREPPFRWAKYAGNWNPGDPRPLTYLIQRSILEKGLHRGITTVNGRWDPQPAHVFTVSNPCLTDEELDEGRAAAARKQLQAPFQLLFVGRTEQAKGADTLIPLARELRSEGIDFRLEVVGGGADQADLEQQAAQAGLGGQVMFRGWLPRTLLGALYSKAHFLVHPSLSEGWPKAVSEAMAYGAVPIAGSVPALEQFFSETGAGVSVPGSDAAAFAAAIQAFIDDPPAWHATSKAGVGAATTFTYGTYVRALAQIFQDEWEISLPVR